MDLVLGASARKDVIVRRRHALDKRVANRLCAVLWVADGRTRLEVAGLLGVSARQVRNWLRLYRNEGLDALCTLRSKGDPGGLRPARLKRLYAFTG